MDNCLLLVVGFVVFLSLGNSMPAKEKPPDGFQNVTQPSNIPFKVYNGSDQPSMPTFPGTNSSDLKIPAENQTSRQTDMNSQEYVTEGGSNFSVPENVFEVNSSIFTNHSVTGANASVTPESGASSADILEDYTAQTDWGEITLAEVNITATPNTESQSSAYTTSMELQNTEISKDKNKTLILEYRNETHTELKADSMYSDINGSVSNARINMSTLLDTLTSKHQGRDLSDVFTPGLVSNSTISALHVGNNVSSNPTNVSGDETDNVLSEKQLDFSQDYVNNSKATEKTDTLLRQGCVNTSEGLTGINCTSNPINTNTSATSPVLANETTGIGLNVSELLVNQSSSPQSTTVSSRLTSDQVVFNYSNLSSALMKSNYTITRTNSSAVSETGSTATPSGSAGHHPHVKATLSPFLQQHYKGVVETILLEELKHGAWEPKVPIEDGPFGSLIWRDKKYLISVLVPIGVGITGAVVIVVVAYAVRSYKRKQKRRAFASPSRTFRPQAQLAIMDQVLLLDDSSDDEF